MRKLVLLIVLLSFVQCQTGTVIPDNTLTGRWVWLQSTGGIAGTTNTPASTKQSIEVEFTADSHQRVYINGLLASDMPYHTIRDKSIYTGEEADMIQYDDDQSKATYSFENGDLIIASECYDCFTSRYTRKTGGSDK